MKLLPGDCVVDGVDNVSGTMLFFAIKVGIPECCKSDNVGAMPPDEWPGGECMRMPGLAERVLERCRLINIDVEGNERAVLEELKMAA